MIKKIFLLSLVVSQLTMSCSSDENTDETTTEPTEQSLAEQIANLLKQPYSSLSPAQQKVKFEAEANTMLTELDKSKTSGAIEAIENLGRLLSLKNIDLFDGKNDNGIEEILTVSGIYGVYTWNDADQIWNKTASSTELKFVFPAKEGQTANNATLSSKSTSSTIKISNTDTYPGWIYDDETGEITEIPSVVDWFYLPTSVDAILTIGGTQAATLSSTAKYSSKNETPDEASYKMTLNDGYTWEISGKKATENVAKASFTYNGKNLIEFNSGSTADIDALIDNDELAQYRGKANGLVKIMDNFIIVADMDLATAAIEDEAFETSNQYPEQPQYESPTADFKAYYTARNNYEKKYADNNIANFNKNMKLILVSKKDGTKIADVVQHSEKGSSYVEVLPFWVDDANYEAGGYWSYNYEKGEKFTVQYYDEVFYLKFNDNTEVEMSAYFSEGFTDLESKFEDFIKAFDK